MPCPYRIEVHLTSAEFLGYISCLFLEDVCKYNCTKPKSICLYIIMHTNMADNEYSYNFIVFSLSCRKKKKKNLIF
jgi:hypothetical protein